jgi:hypothetical protein
MQAAAFASSGYQGISVKSRIALALAASLAAASTFWYGSAVHGRSLLEKYPADWSAFGWSRVSISLLAGAMLFFALRPAIGAARGIDLGQGGEGRFVAGCTLVAGAVLLASAAIVFMVPEILNDTVREGQFVGILTDVVFVVGLAYLGMCTFRARSVPSQSVFGVRPSLLYFAMFFVAFLIMMEEMSWGQHWLGFEAGEFFEGNAQNESNFHNFDTYKFEATYYSTAFLLFVALPNFWPRHRIALLASLEPYIPPRALALAGLPLSGLWFEEWNIIPYQIWFFMGLLIAAQIGADIWRSGGAWRSAGYAMAALLLASEVIFLKFGHNMVDGYELSEIRELLIAFLIAAYARIAYTRLGAVTSPHISV